MDARLPLLLVALLLGRGGGSQSGRGFVGFRMKWK
jgi:hypothetical protein